MVKVRSLVGVAAALIATPLMGLPALGAACVPGTVASYELLGSTGCSVGNLTFFNIDIEGTAGVSFASLNPFNQFGEFGLELRYSANVSGANLSTDVTWLMNVTAAPGVLISDAFASINGTVTGTGSVSLGESIFDASRPPPNQIGSISLTAPNTSDVVFFDPAVERIFVSKDQANFTGTNGSAFTSILVNAYSVVPGPIAGAGLPGLVAACGGLLGFARLRRRRQIA